jgi:uncharacterized membrane protein
VGSKSDTFWGQVRANFRSRVTAGLLVLVPVGITLLILRFLFDITAGFLKPFVAKVVGDVPQAAVVIISVAALLVLLYFTGVLARMLVGRRIIGLGEALVARIPLVKTVYSASKQVVQTLSLPNRGEFKSVAWVQFPHPGLLCLGFITGRMQDAEGRKYYKVFIPTTPNPTTGFFEVLPAEDLVLADVTVEEAIKMVISGGLLSPDHLALPSGFRRPAPGDAAPPQPQTSKEPPE